MLCLWFILTAYICSIPYLEASAKSGKNVTEAINNLLDMVTNRMKEYMNSVGGEMPQRLSTSPSKSKDVMKEKSSCAC